MTLEAQLVLARPDFSLDVHIRAGAGEVVVVLGPNGAGKSTLLRALAGLVPLDRGRITLNGVALHERAPQARDIGVVFQDYRLFPHLSARENVAFPLRSKGRSRAAARAEAAAWLEEVGLQGLEDRKPSALSGGQAQRVALARALCGDPRLLLLDEPLAALDVGTRGDVRSALQRQLESFEGPTLLVTHDPLDALSLADRILVLEDGRVVQDAPPAQVVSRPATPYVARIAGLNLVRGTAVDGVINGQLVSAERLSGPVHAVIRPSAILLHGSRPEGSSARNVLACSIVGMEALGDRVRVSLTGPPQLVADVTAAAVAELRLREGQQVWASIKATEVEAYPV
ncbi:MAG: modC [Frankiales bacterium]|nr:modC [Frankiales bacterium]